MNTDNNQHRLSNTLCVTALPNIEHQELNRAVLKGPLWKCSEELQYQN